MKEGKITPEEKEMFDYLNVLRESGATNMFGAGPYLAQEFGVDTATGRRVVAKWMEHFNADGYEGLVKALNEN